MQFLIKLAWALLLLFIFGGLIVGGILVRNFITVKNYSNYWQQRSIDGGDYIYVALGDSTAVGVGASSPEKSYVGLIAQQIQDTTGKSVRVINLATGDASIDNIITDQIPELSLYKPDLITLTVGSKDIDSNTDISVIAQKFNALFALLPAHSYVAQLPNTLDAKKDQRIQDLNSLIGNEADQAGVNMVPLYDATKKGNIDISYFDWDLSHPNDKGYLLWANTFLSAIQ